MEDIKPPEQSSKTVLNQTPPAGQSPLGGASPTPPQASPFFKLTKPTLIGLGAIILLVSAFTSYFVTSSNQEKTVPQVQTQPSPSPEVSTNEIRLWERYINTRLGFSFAYPINTTLWEGKLASVDGQFTEVPDSVQVNLHTISCGEGMLDNSLFSVVVSKNQNDTRSFGLPNVFSNEVKTKNIKFHGVDALETIEGVPGLLGSDQIGFIKNNSYYLVRGEPCFTNTARRILETFRFTDQNQIDTSNWKTYTNNAYGYSVKFPPEYRAATGGSNSDAKGTEVSFNVDYINATGAPGYPFFYINVVKDKDISGITYNKDGFLESINDGKEVNVGGTFSPQNQSWNATFTRLPDITISNNTFHVYEADTFGKPAADGSKDKRLVINHNGLLFVIGTYYTSNPNDKSPKLFDQILSTFRFLE